MINKIKNIIIKKNLDGYLVPKNDKYFTEYSKISNLELVSNFSGSAGFAIILRKKNYLFVDGRYTIQARYQSGKKFKIVTLPGKFPKDILNNKKKIVLGFDPKLHTEKQLNYLFDIKNITLKSINLNLIDAIWHSKPKKTVRPFFIISPKQTGMKSEKKLTNVKIYLSGGEIEVNFILHISCFKNWVYH